MKAYYIGRNGPNSGYISLTTILFTKGTPVDEIKKYNVIQRRMSEELDERGSKKSNITATLNLDTEEIIVLEEEKISKRTKFQRPPRLFTKS